LNALWHNKWLDEALEQIPADLTDSTGQPHRQIVEEYLRPLLKRCHSKSRKTFWNFLRLSLAKDDSMSTYLMWMRESKCRPEVVAPRDGFRYTVNGGVALIDVGTPEQPAVWQVPVERLDWALSMYPVRLKELPPLENMTLKAHRRLQRKLQRDGRFLAEVGRQELEQEIDSLQQQAERDYAPTPRYELVKSVNGTDVPLHRLYLDAGRYDEVEALDGDFLNYTDTTVRVTMTLKAENGIAIRKGDQPVLSVEELSLPNLRVTNSWTQQRVFEDEMAQYRDAHSRRLAELGQWVPSKSVRPYGASPADDAQNNAQAAWDKLQK
jgi:hypothetical protein